MKRIMALLFIIAFNICFCSECEPKADLIAQCQKQRKAAACKETDGFKKGDCICICK